MKLRSLKGAPDQLKSPFPPTVLPAGGPLKPFFGLSGALRLGRVFPATLQRGLENLPGHGCRERGTTMVVAKGHEVGLSGRVKSFQSPRRKASLRFKTAPLKPKNGLNGPPALGFGK
jgi:hypothetical protein